MNAHSGSYPEPEAARQEPPRRKGRRFPRYPLVLGFSLLGFSVAAIVFGMKTGIGTMVETFGQPVAIRDIVIVGDHDTPISISDARDKSVIIDYKVEEGGFVRGSLRALTRMRQVAGVSTDQPYRLIRWENGAVTLSDTVTGERLFLNAFGPDNVATYAYLLDARGRTQP